VFAEPERKAELQSEFELRTAEAVVAELGQMKGALMKLGQMASYVDQGLPEHVRAAFAQLQADAPPMSAELAAQAIRDELGAPPEVLFARWDPRPIASASIGQVHRATTHDGRDVAVKVQYPGVQEAMGADLQNSDLLFNAVSMMFPGMDPGPVAAEIRERLTEELDYRIEAGHQRFFADAYRGHPYIHIPDVVDELSGERVLTTEFADGVRLEEAATWPTEERQMAAETIYRFVFGSIYQLAAFNGDPHPGNYLFSPGGRVTFLDFGLCKHFTPSEVTDFAEMIERLVLEGDVAAYRAILVRSGLLPSDSDATDEQIADYFGHFYELVSEDVEREVTAEYASESVRRFFDLSSDHAGIMKQVNLPGSWVVIQRINLGLYAVLAELGAHNNWRRIAEELWPFVDVAPSTPMGEVIAQWQEQVAPA
jgi:predicted unusual protein kinase regulating ubiquinone biosynthesis (AarF/ABC1/UbiB family)